VGTHVVNWTVIDVHSLVSFCSFQVDISDDEAPIVTCPSDIQINTQASVCTASVGFGRFTASDNCAVIASGLISNGMYGNNSVFQMGNRTVAYHAQDLQGNNASCTFVVSVQDHEAPAITCPQDLSKSNNLGVCGAVVNYSTPVFRDNCANSTLSLTSGLSPLSNFSVGSSAVTYTTTDVSGNSVACTFNVLVIDAEAPMITCPSSITASASPGLCTQNVTYVNPSAEDNCEIASVTRTAGLASGSLFGVGNTTVTFQVTDTAGLTAQCSFFVVVQDHEAPMLSSCPSNIELDADTSHCYTTVTYTVPTGQDNCPNPVTARTGVASGSQMNVGAQTVDYVVTDVSGNTVTCKFNVTVRDTQLPTISCPLASSTNAPSNACAATVLYNAPVSADNCGGYITSRAAGLASGASFPVGVTPVNYSVTDASGNSAWCWFSVSVVDVTRPVISGCPVSTTQLADSGVCSFSYAYAMPTVADACGSNLVLISGNLPSVPFPYGSTAVSYLANGNDTQALKTFCNFTVNVLDTQAPLIICPSDIYVNNTIGLCGANVSFAAPVGSDNCPNPVTTVAVGHGPGSYFSVGATSEKFTTRENHYPSALTTDCTFNIIVADAEAPVEGK